LVTSSRLAGDRVQIVQRSGPSRQARLVVDVSALDLLFGVDVVDLDIIRGDHQRGSYAQGSPEMV
jgi:hypothetical protein